MAESSWGERTLPPTPRRIERARGEGQVALSRELVAGVVVAAACLVLAVGGSAAVGRLVAYMRAALGGVTHANSFREALRLGLDALLSTLWLPAGAICVAAAAATLAQTRGNVAPTRLRMDGARLWPRLGRVLGRDRALVAVTDVCRLVLLCVAGYLSLQPYLIAFRALPGASSATILATLGAMAQRLGLGFAIVLVGLGLADYLWQLARHHHRLRMTQDEARREHKEDEGAPELKLERLRIHRALNVELGDMTSGAWELVVIDSGVLAVALSYSGSVEDIPVLGTKGTQLVARRMEEVARTAAIPIVEDARLASALALLDEGQPIPESLYQVVAETIVKFRGMLG